MSGERITRSPLESVNCSIVVGGSWKVSATFVSIRLTFPGVLIPVWGSTLLLGDRGTLFLSWNLTRFFVNHAAQFRAQAFDFSQLLFNASKEGRLGLDTFVDQETSSLRTIAKNAGLD